MAAEEKGVLIFGGSGFLGGHVIEQIVERVKSPKIHLFTVNRGIGFRDRWNIGDRICPLIEHNFVCDRDTGSLIKCQELLEHDFGVEMFLIIDFSTYRAEQMRDGLAFVASKFCHQTRLPLYLYISSDAVYEVSRRFVDTGSWPLLKETDAVRPVDESERKRLAEWDDYAEGKMAAEEVLVNEHGDVPYLALRLPDVIGPRDSWGDTWWKFQTWLQIVSYQQPGGIVAKPIRVPSWLLEKPISYTFVVDVARFIAEICEIVWQHPPSSSSTFRNQIYNLANPKPVKLLVMLETTKQQLRKPSRMTDLSTIISPIIINNDAIPLPVDIDRFLKANLEFAFPFQLFYPTVTPASAISMAKFTSHFPDFQFTPFEEAIKATVAFFADVSKYEQHHNRFTAMLQLLLSDLISNHIIEPTDKHQFMSTASLMFKM